MELKTNNLCNGCLTQDRKITLISSTASEEGFLQILNEINVKLMVSSTTKNINLCWECEAKLKNFLKFKEQVKRSYELLSNQSTMITPLKSSLTTKSIINISISMDTESSEIRTVKIEADSHFSDHNHDYTSDDISLIDISKVKEKKKRLKKKRKSPSLKKDKISINSNKSKDKFINPNLKNHKIIDHDETKVKITNHDETKDKITNHDDMMNETKDKIADCYETKDKITDHDVKKDKTIKHVEIKNKFRDENEEDIFKIVELNSEEVNEERDRLQKSEDYVNAMFRCEKCIISFLNEDDLKEHVQKKHELHASKHKCSICECSFSSEVSLNYHRNTHTKRYQCKICNERTQNKRAAVKHYELAHCYSETYELETKDDIKMNDSIKNEISENNGEKEDGYSCELCDKVFRWKTSLRKHLEMHQIEAGQKRRPYCEPCGLTFTTTSNLQRHAKTSSKHQIKLKLRKLKETNDGNAEENLMKLNDIKNSVLSNKELYSCPQCEKKFEWRGNMLRHLHTHVSKAKGELVCKPCNRTFSSKATYKQHLEISKKHVSENDFKHMCSDCGKRYPNKWKLKEHVNWEHLKNYVHSCEDCQKVFKCNTSLYLHRQMAHKANECLCDLCGKSFSNKTKLQSHIAALHSTEAPYKCKSCSARFTWQSCLSRHVRRLHNNVAN